jgi:hypothetical protein
MTDLESTTLRGASASQLEIALAHAAVGRRVFPFRLSEADAGGHRDKTPLVRWTAEATTDPDTIRRWATRFPTAHYGWNLEPGLVVVDIDDFAAFAGTGLELPPAPSQTTPSGGSHHLYQDDGVKQTVKAIPGLDTRVGGKGFVGLYTVDAFAGTPASAPAWLMDVGGKDASAPSVEVTEEDPVTSREELMRLMGSWRQEGKTHAEIKTLLFGMYAEGTLTESDPSRPWTKQDLEKLASEAAKWPAGEIVDAQTVRKLTVRAVARVPEEPVADVPLPAVPGLMMLAYPGLAGEFVDLVMPTTEGDPAGVLFSFLTWFGTAVGRGPYTMIGSTRHHANLSAVIVGDTSKARKGIGGSAIKEILDPVEKLHKVHASTGEGIITAIEDAKQEWDQKTKKFVAHGGVEDKRLLLEHHEFGGLLTVMGRPGNTLSAVLRQAWDGDDLSVAVRGGGEYRASNPHVSVLGNITREELTALLTQTDATSGFGNRILWVYAQRRKTLPRPPGLNPERVAEFQEKLHNLLTEIHGAGSYEVKFWRLDRDQTVGIWDEAYERLSSSAGPGLVGKLTDRQEAQARRLALVYALLGGRRRMIVQDLYAAFAAVSYSAQTVRFIAGGLGATSDENRVLTYLRGMAGGTASRSAIRTEVFSGHKSSPELDSLRDKMIASGLIGREEVAVAGRQPSEAWKLR